MQDFTFYVYSLFIIILASIIIKTKTENVFIQTLIIVSFVLVTGFRDLDVPDTPEYFDIFKLYNNKLFDEQFLGQEIGFIVFGKIIKLIWDSHVIYFSLIALVNILLIRKALENLGVNKCLGMIAYISFYGLSVNFIFLRVGIAMSLFVYFFSLYQKNRSLLGVPVLILAPFFHKSIVLPIILFPIVKLRFSRRLYFFLILISLTFYFSGFSVFIIQKLFELVRFIPYFSKYLYYIDNVKLTSGFSIRHVFNMVMLLCVVYLISDLERIKPLLNLCVLGVLLTSLLSAFLWVDRITDSLVMFNIFIMSIFVFENGSNQENRINSVLFYLFLIFNLVFVSRIMTLFIFKDMV